MKKLFFNVLTWMVLLLAAPLVSSCGDDDDDAVEQKVDRIFVYEANVPEDCLNLFDVKLVLYRGTKTKDVMLSASQGEPVSGRPGNLRHFLYDGFDGMEGIDSVKSVCSAKADIKSMLEAMDPNQPIYLGAETSMRRYKNGKPLEGGANATTNNDIVTSRPSLQLSLFKDGQPNYVHTANNLHLSFDAKPVAANF